MSINEKMKTLHLSIIVFLLIAILFPFNTIFAQIQTQSLMIQLSIPKFNFVDGEIIPISGHFLPNSIIKISLSDNLGNLENSTQVSVNSTGYFQTTLDIPLHVIGGGSWQILATSAETFNALQIMVNTHGVDTMPSNFPSRLSPLKQFNLGMMTNMIQCHSGLQLVIKAEDGSPACVKPDTVQKLIERGWAANLVDNAENGTIKQTVDRKFPHAPDGFGCGMWSNATGWVKGICVSPNIPHP